MKGKVFVYAEGRGIPTRIREALHPGLDVVHVSKRPWFPRRCHLYVMTTAYSAKTEHAAAAMGATPVVLPEQHAWLADEVIKLAGRGDVYLFVPSRVGDRA